MTISSGARLGAYEIISAIGAGGMGEVYRARDPRLGRDVAIKTIVPTLAQDKDRIRRFELEARAAGSLNHPNILAIYDVGIHEGSLFVVSELLDGQTLAERLAGGRLAPRKAIEIALQICAGLGAAHAKGIVHRDLKPGNVFITTDGRIKILDFGLAKLRLPPEAEQQQATVSLATAEGLVLGTAAYMSPEQVRAGQIDHRSDIFSFGAVLYEMLSGKRAFNAPTTAEIMTAVLREETPELTGTGVNVSPALDRIVRRCLEKQPEERFESIRDVAFALDAISTSTAAERPVLPAARSAPARAATVALIVGLVAGLTTLAFMAGRRRAPGEIPSFQLLTFRRGIVTGARFAPDGRTVVYSAAWDGGESELFSTRAEAPGSQPIGLKSALLMSVSRSGEMAALLTRDRHPANSLGTLARFSLGSAPRQVTEGVKEADWAPDGDRLCVLRQFAPGDLQIEFPVGHPLVRGDVYWPRVSPKGDRVAFIGDGVEVVDLDGHRTTIASEPEFIFGLAWSPRGDEVWFTAGELATNRALYAATLDGHQRLVTRVPGSLTLWDISREGRVLLAYGTGRLGIIAAQTRGSNARELSILSRSVLAGFNHDGSAVLIGEGAEPAPAVYLRSTDGSPPVRLGVGIPLALSPDASRALLSSPTPHRLLDVPTGPGEAKPIDFGPLSPTDFLASWSADGERLFVTAQQKDRRPQIFVRTPDNRWQLVTPEGVYGRFAVAPDGNRLAATGPTGDVTLYTVGGGTGQQLTGERGTPIGWTADGAALYVREPGDVPAVVHTYDLSSGRTKPWQTLIPPDPTGVTAITNIFISADGGSYALRTATTDSCLISTWQTV